MQLVNLSSYLVHFEICESLAVEAASNLAAVPIRPSQLRQNSEAVLKCRAVEMLFFHLAVKLAPFEWRKTVIRINMLLFLSSVVIFWPKMF